MHKNLPKIIVITGPTASGKTDLALALAQVINGVIISADSRQVYRKMDIGTAKSGKGELGIDLVDPDQEFSVVDYKKYAEEKIDEILKAGKTPMLVGGSWLWILAVIDNLDIPDVAPDHELRENLEKMGADQLFLEYAKLDPVGAERIDAKNKRRLIRAIEVCKISGRPFSELRKLGEQKYDSLILCLDIEREELYDRVNRRVDLMNKVGLVNEVRDLIQKYDTKLPAMSGIGYAEIIEFLNGKITLEQSLDKIKNNTRDYVRRQLTWFRAEPRINWVKNIAQAREILLEFLALK